MTLEYQIKSVTLPRKDSSGLVMWYTKTMLAMLAIHTRRILQIEDLEDKYQSSGVI